MSGIDFDKYEGLGNDFVVIDARDLDAMAASLARRLCDRRFGIGADGVLLVLPPDDPAHVARMRVVNADGSIPEMCGNGLRCVALHVARRREVEHLAGVFETDAGVREVALDRTRGHAEVRVDMGTVRVAGERTLEIAGERVTVVAADAGNPHAILLPIGREHDRARIERLGSAIETHEAFPRGTNVELVSRDEDGSLRLTVWERGVGFTLACGTGACAAVAVLVARGECADGELVLVHLPGGDLRVTVTGERASMEGPARHVFSGRAP
jgi:diaminopimelate epimerase